MSSKIFQSLIAIKEHYQRMPAKGKIKTVNVICIQQFVFILHFNRNFSMNIFKNLTFIHDVLLIGVCRSVVASP